MSKKLLLIGWDAADWRVIHPLVDAGKMPNLARFLEGGICGNLATLQPVLSPMLWTSIATGKRPYKHGVHGFSEPDPVSGGIRPVTNLSRKTKAMWNILNQEDHHSIVTGWWPSHPAEPLGKGVMVSNHYQRATGDDHSAWPMPPGTVHPERLAKVLAELRFHPTELSEKELAPFLPGLTGMSQEELDEVAKDPRLQSLAKITAECTSIHSAATALMQNEPWDFMAVYYDAIDHYGHAFMKFHPPRREHIDERDFRIFNYCLEGGYIYHDMMLGTLLQLAGDDTTVVLMSDHGFHPDHLRPRFIPREPAGPAVEHRQFGIFAAMGPGIKKDANLFGASVLDVAPTVLHHFGLPVGEDMDGKVLLDIWEEPAAIARIPSWDEVAGDDGSHPPGKQISPADSKAALDQLVALGYIDAPAEDQQEALDETVRELDYNLACSYLDGGIFSEATVILERLYEQWPLQHRFGIHLAACYRNLGRTADLREVTATVIKRRLEEAKDAAETLQALKLDDPKAQEEEKERIERMTTAEKEKFGRQRRELFAAAQPNLFTLHYLEAVADFMEKNNDGALAKLEQLDDDYGARRKALTLRGEVQLRRRDWEAARRAFNDALEIDPESPTSHLGLARAALGEGSFDEAVQHATASIGLLFFQPRAHYLAGMAHYRARRWQDAEHSFLLAARQAPLMAANYRMLGEIARHYKNDPAEALQFRRLMQEARKRLRESRDLDRTAAGLMRPPADDTPLPDLLPRPEVLDGVAEDEIITVVTGLPRSGTSLMMQILAAAGIPAFTDEKRGADDDNPRGYFEHGKIAGLLRDGEREWLGDARGKAIKVVAPLLPSLPPQLDQQAACYRVLFMERDMDEILQSQERMMTRLDSAPEAGGQAADVSRAYRQQVRAARNTLARRGIPALAVNFAELLADPAPAITDIARFLGNGAPAKIPAMAACIDPALYRARKEEAPATTPG